MVNDELNQQHLSLLVYQLSLPDKLISILHDQPKENIKTATGSMSCVHVLCPVLQCGADSPLCVRVTLGLSERAEQRGNIPPLLAKARAGDRSSPRRRALGKKYERKHSSNVFGLNVQLMMSASHHLHQALSGSLAGGADGPGFFGLLPI